MDGPNHAFLRKRRKQQWLKEPEARNILPEPECVTRPILELDMAKAGVSSIIWATGFGVDFSGLQVNAFDANGKPQHQRGVSSEPGVYFLGLPWLLRQGSTFIWGVWHDAKHIATQCKYAAYYHDAAQEEIGQSLQDGPGMDRKK